MDIGVVADVPEHCAGNPTHADSAPQGALGPQAGLHSSRNGSSTDEGANHVQNPRGQPPPLQD
eukprot:9803212-Lingulodinium_polyedra.AAC.1